MRITSEVIDRIKEHFSKIPNRESGGIIGTENGIVTKVIFDDGKDVNHPCMYAPDTQMLNNSIEKWQEENVDFAGLFHTHFGGAGSLSDTDKAYIKTIISAMPEDTGYLYFPIVCIPECNITAFKASLNGGELMIVHEDVTIL